MKIKGIPTKSEISEIHEMIKPYIHQTPVFASSAMNELSRGRCFFKCENFQKIGAFKMRGATSAGLALTAKERSKGIATHSSGNHAQAVALTAKNLGIPAYIVMPENAPKIKRTATEGYGAKVISCKGTIESRESTMAEVLDDVGATFIHPYNNYNVIAGAATVAKEFIDSVPELDYLLAPIGGGGLVSGTLLSAAYFSKGIRVIGVEPMAVDDAYRSLLAGSIQKNETTDTIGDGLKTNLGEYTFEIISKYIDRILTVSEQSIISSMKTIWSRMKIIIEPSSAVVVAALLHHPEIFSGKTTGLILSGGNIDLDRLPWS